MAINFSMMSFADRLALRDDYQSLVPGERTPPPEVAMDEKMPKNMQTLPFDPEGSEYDYETAKQKGLDPKDIVRQDLYPGEDKYFKENSNVGGMMTEDNRVIINPYSKLTDEEKDAVRINETLRLNFKQDNVVPNIEISEEQRSFFKETPYENNEDAMKQTIMARILTGDPSAKATEEQLKEAETDLFKAYKENIDHWGSVVPASDEDKLKYNLPEESYLLVKGKQHKTWDKAIQGEADRGFRVKKFGDRYYSIPAEINEEGKDVEISKPLSVESIVKDWSATYQTTNNPEKEKRATKVLNNFNPSTMPKEAVSAVETASYIFEGDKGQTAESIAQNLNAIGAIESNYKTKVQKGGGPARSYWQVEPTTAQDNLINGSALLGKRFEEKFKRYAKDGKTAVQYLKGLTLKEWSEVLEKDDELGAAMAAHKFIRTRK